MVEGHSVHRCVGLIIRKMRGKKFKAFSPNKRFEAGAKAIDGKKLTDAQAIGKNLFAFFGKGGFFGAGGGESVSLAETS